MVDSAQQRGRIWRAPLALTFLLASVVVGTQSQAQTFTVLHTFHGNDGADPIGQLIRDNDGNFYGTTIVGGTGNCQGGCGAAFKMNKSGRMVWVHSFKSGNGRQPLAGLLRDEAGDLFGTTELGGLLGCAPPDGCGTVFKLNIAGKETVLHKFNASQSGYGPESLLVEDSEGNLYGTTYIGGEKGYGTVFKIDKAGGEKILHNFTGGSDGCTPSSGVIRDWAGNLYGVTLDGGAGFCNSGLGVVFKVDTAGHETVLHTFSGGNGANPSTALLFDQQGNLYGATDNGGTSDVCDRGCGTVFELSPQEDGSWSETVLYNFCSLSNCADGEEPARGPLVRDAAGNLYGTTYFWGKYINCNGSGCGVVFKLDTNGKESVLHNFKGAADGAEPFAGLAIDAAGNLYGAALEGGDLKCKISGIPGCGTVFKITP
jgi:uncharacterized repeat protein (TIGR03803 family)